MMNPEIFGRVPPAKLAALCAYYSSKPSPSWLLDSGATSHITNDIANLSVASPYTGEDKVYIGDGKGLPIHNIGISSLDTSHTSFKLRNVLHVPAMKHNLLSAYQFLKDNNCALTLDPDGSTVKDRVSGKTLLRGRVEDGFYPLQGSSPPTSSSPSALISVKAPVQIWHRRLGHPDLRRSHNLPCCGCGTAKPRYPSNLPDKRFGQRGCGSMPRPWTVREILLVPRI
jgi:histone deacetylase 1/2